MPAPPTMVDADLDGFIDTAYIGDLGREHLALQILLGHRRHRLRHVELDRLPPLPARRGHGSVYAAPSAAKDPKGNLWLFWGTGDRLEPITVGGGADRIYAVKDTGSAVTLGQLENVTSSNLCGHGREKRLVYRPRRTRREGARGAGHLRRRGVLHELHPEHGGDVCQQGQGTANLYALGYLTAASATGTGNRSIQVGYGIPTAPIVSFKPGGTGTPDLYVTVSSGDYTSTQTVKAAVSPPVPSNRSNMLFWRDRRVQSGGSNPSGSPGGGRERRPLSPDGGRMQGSAGIGRQRTGHCGYGNVHRDEEVSGHEKETSHPLCISVRNHVFSGWPRSAGPTRRVSSPPSPPTP